MILFAYVSYLIAEYIEISGLIVIFICGITMSHYALYNVTDECFDGSRIAVETCSMIAESFLYGYLGLTALSIKPEVVDMNFLWAVLGITTVARLVSVYSSMFLLWLINKCKT